MNYPSLYNFNFILESLIYYETHSSRGISFSASAVTSDFSWVLATTKLLHLWLWGVFGSSPFYKQFAVDIIYELVNFSSTLETAAQWPVVFHLTKIKRVTHGLYANKKEPNYNWIHYGKLCIGRSDAAVLYVCLLSFGSRKYHFY